MPRRYARSLLVRGASAQERQDDSAATYAAPRLTADAGAEALPPQLVKGWDTPVEAYKIGRVENG